MTITALHTWLDFDSDGYETSATVIGFDSAIAIILDGPNHDEFLRLALAAPDLLEAAQSALKTLERASLQLTENHKMVLKGKAWGSSDISALRSAIKQAKGE